MYSNQTPNYELPQYVADDKPTYLGDFNKAMLDIDTAIKNNDNKAEQAVSTANTSNANATEALTLASTANANASNANTKADNAITMANNAQEQASNAEGVANNAKTIAETATTNASNATTVANNAKSTADTAKSTADSTKTEVETLKNNIDGWQKQDNVLTISNINGNLTCLYNEALHLIVFYGDIIGYIDYNTTIGKLPSFVPNPDNNRTIQNMGIMHMADNTNDSMSVQIDTNGNIIRKGKQARSDASFIQCMICNAFWNE